MALKYPPTLNGLQKTLGAQLAAGATSSALLSNTTGVQNKSGVILIDRIDANGNELETSRREWIGYSGTSGSTVTTLTRGLGGSSDQVHEAGAVVEFVPDVTVFQAILDALANMVDVSTLSVDLTKLVTPTGSQTMTGKTISGASNTLTVREADLSIADNTTGDVSTSAHGFVPKAPNDTTKFLRGDGTWATNAVASFIGAKAYNSATQSINDTSETTLTFNSEEFDTDTMHDTSSNTSRLTINTSGKYEVTYNVNFGVNATGRRYATIMKNGSEINGGLCALASSGSNDVTSLSKTIVLDLTATDYLEVKVYQTSGGALGVVGGNSNARSTFSAFKIG